LYGCYQLPQNYSGFIDAGSINQTYGLRRKVRNILIEHISYEVKGNDVLVTYQDGMAKGMAIRYTMTSQNTAENALGSLQRLN
jgi:hypothetical protein